MRFHSFAAGSAGPAAVTIVALSFGLTATRQRARFKPHGRRIPIALSATAKMSDPKCTPIRA